MDVAGDLGGAVDDVVEDLAVVGVVLVGGSRLCGLHGGYRTIVRPRSQMVFGCGGWVEGWSSSGLVGCLVWAAAAMCCGVRGGRGLVQ